MKVVHMHESLVWFPAIRAFVVTSPSRNLGRAARREPKASLDRSLHGPAGGVRGLVLWDSRISAKKQRLRSPARSGSSMVLFWRGAPILQLQKAYAGDLSGPSSTTRPRRPATSSTSRSSPRAELHCDPLCRGVSSASEAHSTQQVMSFAESKARFEQQPTTFAESLARFSETGSTMSASCSVCSRVSGPRRTSTR